MRTGNILKRPPRPRRPAWLAGNGPRDTGRVRALRVAVTGRNGMKAADHDNPHADVYAAEERRTRAMVEGDLSVLSALIEDDCRYVHSSGVVDTKATYLEKLQTGEVGYTWIRSSQQVVIDVGAGMAISHLMEAQLVLSGVSRPPKPSDSPLASDSARSAPGLLSSDSAAVAGRPPDLPGRPASASTQVLITGGGPVGLRGHGHHEHTKHPRGYGSAAPGSGGVRARTRANATRTARAVGPRRRGSR